MRAVSRDVPYMPIKAVAPRDVTALSVRRKRRLQSESGGYTIIHPYLLIHSTIQCRRALYNHTRLLTTIKFNNIIDTAYRFIMNVFNIDATLFNNVDVLNYSM